MSEEFAPEMTRMTVSVPDAIRGTGPKGEDAPSAWGPFEIYCGDQEDQTQPMYVGSRLRFEADPRNGTIWATFYPIEPPSSKMYRVLRGPENVEDRLEFWSAEHGLVTFMPVAPDELALARELCDLN